MENSEKSAIELRQEKIRIILLEQLKKTPIAQIACEKSGVSRATYYRWRKDDKLFAQAADTALLDGSLLINDMAESQLMQAIKDRNLTAIIFWLKHHHRDYTTTLKIKHSIDDEVLTPEQEKLVRKALQLAGGKLASSLIINRNENEQYNTATGNDGCDDQRPESTNSNN